MSVLAAISNAYYRFKGIVFYKLLFKRFGSHSLIRRPLLIANPRFITIGDHVTIRAGIRLEAIQSKQSRIPRLDIGSGTNIEQNVHIVCHNRISIGSRVSITGHCAIVDVTHPFDDVTLADKIGTRIKDEDSWVEIGDGAFLGYGAVILPNVRIGSFAVVGANSVVTGDIPDYSVAAGAPARIIRHYDFATKKWVRA